MAPKLTPEERVTLAVYVPLAFVWGNTASPFVPSGPARATNGPQRHPIVEPQHAKK